MNWVARRFGWAEGSHRGPTSNRLQVEEKLRARACAPVVCSECCCGKRGGKAREVGSFSAPPGSSDSALCVCVFVCVCVCVSPPPLHWAALRASLATRARYAWRYVHTTHTAPSACSSEARLFFFLRYFCLEYRLDSLSLSSLFAYLFERARARGRERRAHPPPLLFLFPIQLFSLSLSVPSFHIYVHTKTPNFVGWL